MFFTFLNDRKVGNTFPLCHTFANSGHRGRCHQIKSAKLKVLNLSTLLVAPLCLKLAKVWHTSELFFDMVTGTNLLYFEKITIYSYNGDQISVLIDSCYASDLLCDGFYLYKHEKLLSDPFWHENWFTEQSNESEDECQIVKNDFELESIDY